MLPVYFIVIALFKLQAPLDVSCIWISVLNHWKVPLQHWTGHQLKIIEVVRLAKKIDRKEAIDKSCGQLSRFLHMRDDGDSDSLNIYVRFCPIGKLDKDGTWNLHVEDIVCPIA